MKRKKYPDSIKNLDTFNLRNNRYLRNIDEFTICTALSDGYIFLMKKPAYMRFTMDCMLIVKLQVI